MKCSKCGHAMERQAVTLTAEVRGEPFQVKIEAPQCIACGRIVLGSKSRRMYNRAASDAFRSKHDLLTSREIDQMRRSLGMTWKQFADFVEIGIATLKRWMGGEVQTHSLDRLVRLRADPAFAQRALDDLMVRLMPPIHVTMPDSAAHAVTRRANVSVTFDQASATDTEFLLAA